MLETTLQEDSDEDEESSLNLAENDGMLEQNGIACRTGKVSL